MRISDWSSDVCSSDLRGGLPPRRQAAGDLGDAEVEHPAADTAALQRRLARHAAQTQLHRPEQSAVVGVRLNKEAGGARHPASVGAVLQRPHLARKSVVSGIGVSVRGDLGGRRILKKKKIKYIIY